MPSPQHLLQSLYFCVVTAQRHLGSIANIWVEKPIADNLAKYLQKVILAPQRLPQTAVLRTQKNLTKEIYTMLPLAFVANKQCFDVCDTLECGQIFRYKKIAENAYGVFSWDKYAELKTTEAGVEVYTDDADYFWHFFDLDTNYAEKVARISALSPIMEKACNCGKGIHILNQNLTEMIFSFIISANNNIKRIQLIINRLCDALGESTPYGKAFPTIEALANAPLELFTSVGAGYRDKYLKSTAQALLSYDLQSLFKMNTLAARTELLKFLGVGPKVADCILLFGMHRGDVFPVDTWLKKVYHAYFEQGHRDNEISTFFTDLFGFDAGLCQQYLFYYQRKYGQTGGNAVK